VLLIAPVRLALALPDLIGATADLVVAVVRHGVGP
jgi:hypothetical protein